MFHFGCLVQSPRHDGETGAEEAEEAEEMSNLSDDSTLPKRLRKMKGNVEILKKTRSTGGLCPICGYPIMFHNAEELEEHRNKARELIE